MWKFFLFLIINFLALGIGSWLMGNPATNEWYNGLNKAPWTPPGWVFGAAWFTVMFCFAVYMFKGASLFPAEKLNMLYVLFAVQFVLNVLWNPIFFRWHFVAPGLIIISLLAIVMVIMLVFGKNQMGWNTLWVLPYVLWLCIATSLNAYVLFKN
ncbi:MAG: TspO/MBR family protein [Chitinophagales bacterium]|jgi:benzodiazapine receptor|nr:tryptophan-rich sensory protein [Bacteroidota bacterium]MBK9554418.1 tryptophan-rich sensory protein [Bacteroidota bacterium]